MKELFVVLLFAGLKAGAVEIPQEILSGRSDHLSRALEDSCFLMTLPADLPCNPAFLAGNEGEVFHLQGFATSHGARFRQAYDIVSSAADLKSLEEFVSQKNTTLFEADIEAIYLRNHFAVSFSPSRISYYTLFRNQVLPYVSTFISQEQILRIQSGWAIDDEVSVGIQVRGFFRRFVMSDFFLTSAVAEDGEKLLCFQQESLLYLEPGVEWQGSEQPWNPKVVLALVRFGLRDPHDSDVPFNSRGVIGASIRPPQIENDALEVGGVLVIGDPTTPWPENIRVSTVYENSKISYSLSLQKSEGAAGVFARFGKLNAGFLYKNRMIEDVSGQRDNLETWSIQIGL